MYKFYIIFKGGSEIKGQIQCERSDFIIRFINPSIDDIYTYQIWREEEEENVAIWSDWKEVDF